MLKLLRRTDTEWWLIDSKFECTYPRSFINNRMQQIIDVYEKHGADLRTILYAMAKAGAYWYSYFNNNPNLKSGQEFHRMLISEEFDAKYKKHIPCLKRIYKDNYKRASFKML